MAKLLLLNGAQQTTPKSPETNKGEYNLFIYDIDINTSSELVKKGAIWKNSIKDIVDSTSLIITCLQSPQSVTDVVE